MSDTQVSRRVLREQRRAAEQQRLRALGSPVLADGWARAGGSALADRPAPTRPEYAAVEAPAVPLRSDVESSAWTRGPREHGTPDGSSVQRPVSSEAHAPVVAPGWSRQPETVASSPWAPRGTVDPIPPAAPSAAAVPEDRGGAPSCGPSKPAVPVTVVQLPTAEPTIPEGMSHAPIVPPTGQEAHHDRGRPERADTGSARRQGRVRLRGASRTPAGRTPWSALMSRAAQRAPESSPSSTPRLLDADAQLDEERLVGPGRRDRPASSPTPVEPLRQTLAEVARDVVGLGSRGGRRAWTRSIQVVVVAAAVLTLVVGIRTMFFAPAASSVPYSATFPEALAASTAQRFATSYFTWDASDPSARADALANVMQRGLSTQAGWDGTGRSEAGSATATGITLVDASTALVTVVVPVTSYTGAPGAWHRDATQDLALSIPIAVSGSRTWVSGLPASVAVPEPSSVSAPDDVVVDAALTSTTSAPAARFFASIARHDVVVAPGSGGTVTGLDGELSYRALVSWRVAESSSAEKSGYASVRWATKGGTSLVQDYRVVLTDDAGDGWHIRGVTAAYSNDGRNGAPS